LWPVALQGVRATAGPWYGDILTDKLLDALALRRPCNVGTRRWIRVPYADPLREEQDVRLSAVIDDLPGGHERFCCPRDPRWIVRSGGPGHVPLPPIAGERLSTVPTVRNPPVERLHRDVFRVRRVDSHATDRPAAVGPCPDGDPRSVSKYVQR